MYKTKEDKWNAFEELAIAKLLKGQAINDRHRYIQLYVNPTFSNKFVLQLELFQNQVNWYFYTWKSDLDRLKIYSGPLEKELPEPTLFLEKGMFSKDAFQHILDLIKKMSICPYIEEDWGDYRDGEIYTLTIGFKGCITNYTWHYLPDKWDGLQQIANALMELNRELSALK